MQQLHEQRTQLDMFAVLAIIVARFSKIEPNERVYRKFVVAVPNQAAPQRVEKTTLVGAVVVPQLLQEFLPSRRLGRGFSLLF